jgi:hypothetical protein
MEIREIRKELTALLANIIEHSNKYSDGRTIPSLEVGAVLTKINRLQEKMAVLRHLLVTKEKEIKQQNKQQRTLDRAASITPLEPINLAVSTPETPVFNEVSSEGEKAADAAVEGNAPVAEVFEPKVAKLSDTLTLNDRYLYANELFNKDMSVFNELVKAIDNCASFEAAQKLYFSLDWEIENEHVLSFTNLVDRRFS